ncbi:hypothetical protein C3942_13020 [Solimonas fluminis]|uniref:Uncharacterized protein n=1 Tax=Solimonas fluminis TaxID=2086571 RepID=A0A2S5TFT8_9GAMM|nr:hypothetical protein [Solimonas fluminis]PPE73708.1 hypothetical protein C3942_13020 [Solimonas fluminis]
MPRSPLLAGLLLAAVLSACSRSEAPAAATPGPGPEEPAPRVMRCPPAPGAQDVAVQQDGRCAGAGARS